MSKPAPGMGQNAKQPRGSAPEMATETISTTFDKGGNDKPLSWSTPEAGYAGEDESEDE